MSDIDPGSICEDCGHFACRHDGLACYFPGVDPEDSSFDCQCGGMLWRDERWIMDCRTGPLRRVMI